MSNPEAPVYEVFEFAEKRTSYCLIVTSLNEGERIRRQLERMSARSELADILIADGASTDGSTEHSYLKSHGVRALLVTTEQGLGTALCMGFDFALQQGYDGVVTVDGNGKDGVESLPEFLRLLDEGYDFVQGSRFLDGGEHKNTPLERYVGVRYVVSPLLWLGGGFLYTDPTNGFKALSRRFMADERVRLVRRVFARFSMQHYENYRAAKLGFRIIEIPVSRVYPDDGSVPTKITSIAKKILLVWELLLTVVGAYNPPKA